VTLTLTMYVTFRSYVLPICVFAAVVRLDESTCIQTYMLLYKSMQHTIRHTYTP